MLRTLRIMSAAVVVSAVGICGAYAQETDKPNILVIWGDDIGTWNISHNNRGMMGYETPNIDRIANEGLSFTDYYAQQSCTAARSAAGGTCSAASEDKAGTGANPLAWCLTA